MTGYETAVVRLYGAGAGRPTAGLGVLVGRQQVVTCAHVVNAALGRDQRGQERPGDADWVQVEFPLLPGTPVRLARVVAWAPPPRAGEGTGDVAGLLLGEEAPAGASCARLAGETPRPGARLRVFGYPGRPARDMGMWVDVDLKGEVGGVMLQVESRGDQSVKAQPGYSGSPVWDDATGQPAGLLHAAPFADEPERDAYVLPSLAVARAWEECFDYLLVPENPYRGLEPFTAEHAPVFFGRDDEVADLTGLVTRQPVTVVVGPSGVGKSSLVQAGLIPALRRRQPWSVALARPGQDPWLRLAGALLRAQNGSQAEVTFEQAERESQRLRADGFGPAARFLRSENRTLLVVVDQFEELLAAGGPPDQALLDLLLPRPVDAEPAARLVLTLRADFQATLQSVPGSHTRLNERLYLLSPLTQVQMRQVVERPAAARGVGFEAGLVNRILADAAGGALPVLEFTLTKLWETQRQRTVTFDGYEQMKGVRGALNRFADEKAAELGDTSPDVLDRVLLRLVRTPTADASLATRQRVFQSELPPQEWEVMRRLGEARLVTLDTAPDGTAYAELVHESLITAWQRVHVLIAENAEFLGWLSRVAHRAEEGDPLPEARIAEARRWLDTRPEGIPDAVATFVRNSETAAEAKLRELRDARDRAEAAREQAEAAARRAEALRLAAAAELALQSVHSPVVTALGLAAESVLTAPTMPGDLALRHALRLQARVLARLEHGAAVNAVAFSPDGTRLATASDDHSARLFDVVSGEQLARLEHKNRVYAVAFSPDGTRLATVGHDHSARLFDVTTGQQLARIEHEDPVFAVAFSPDGTRFATGGGSGRRGAVRLFEVVSGQQVARLEHGGRVNAVAFSPDGTTLAAASDDHSARLFDVVSGEQLARLEHDSNIRTVVFSWDGTRLATASDDKSARLFATVSGEQLARLEHEDPVNTVAFSPDGAQVVTGGGVMLIISGGSAQVFDAVGGRRLADLNHGSKVNAVAFSPDGTRFATGSGQLGSDGSLRVFDAASWKPLAWLDHKDRVNAVAFSPDGTRVATAGQDGAAQVCRAAPGERLGRLAYQDALTTVVLSPDRTRVAFGTDEGSVQVFDLATSELVTQLDLEGRVEMATFSPDGARLAVAAQRYGEARGGSVWLVEAATATRLARLEHESQVAVVAFSPDGARLATACDDYSVRVLDAVTGAQRTRLDSNGSVAAMVFSPGGERIAVAGGTSVGLFDAASGEQAARLEHQDTVHAVAFSPSGTQLATSCEDGAVRVFDLASGATLTRMEHENAAYLVEFSPDGARIATASGELMQSGSVLVFDVASGEQLVRLEHEIVVYALAFSPDGTRILTVSMDGTTRTFTVSSALQLRQAIEVMTRPLDPAELRFHSLQPGCRHISEWNRVHQDGRPAG